MKTLEPGIILRFPKKSEYKLDKNGLHQVKCEVIRPGQSPIIESIPINLLRVRNKRTPLDIPYTECHEIIDKDGCIIACEYINKHSHHVGNKVITTCEITVLPTHMGLMKRLVNQGPIRINKI